MGHNHPSHNNGEIGGLQTPHIHYKIVDIGVDTTIVHYITILSYKAQLFFKLYVRQL